MNLTMMNLRHTVLIEGKFGKKNKVKKYLKFEIFKIKKGIEDNPFRKYKIEEKRPTVQNSDESIQELELLRNTKEHVLHKNHYEGRVYVHRNKIDSWTP